SCWAQSRPQFFDEAHVGTLRICYGRFSGLRRRLMRRREFLATALGMASMSPLGAFGQPSSRVAKVGHLESGFPSTAPNLLAAFRQGLRDLGYVDGQNLFIVSPFGEGREERPRPPADELVQYGVDVIFAIGPPQAVAVAKATDKI